LKQDKNYKNEQIVAMLANEIMNILGDFNNFIHFCNFYLVLYIIDPFDEALAYAAVWRGSKISYLHC